MRVWRAQRDCERTEIATEVVVVAIKDDGEEHSVDRRLELVVLVTKLATAKRRRGSTDHMLCEHRMMWWLLLRS